MADALIRVSIWMNVISCVDSLFVFPITRCEFVTSQRRMHPSHVPVIHFHYRDVSVTSVVRGSDGNGRLTSDRGFFQIDIIGMTTIDYREWIE